MWRSETRRGQPTIGTGAGSGQPMHRFPTIYLTTSGAPRITGACRARAVVSAGSGPQCEVALSFRTFPPPAPTGGGLTRSLHSLELFLFSALLCVAPTNVVGQTTTPRLAASSEPIYLI